MKRLGWILPIALAALVVDRFAAQTPEPTGSLRGCITDGSGQSLPGVTVDVNAGGIHRTAVSNRDNGCYEFSDLPAASYIFFARLPAFYSFTRDEVRVLSQRVEQLDFQMCVAALCECVMSPPLPSLFKNADAVVHVRITGHEPTHASCGQLKHTAAIVTSWKGQPKAIDPTIEFLQGEPYAIGQEFVLFLQRQLGRNAFQTLDSFPIEDGKVRSGPLSGYVEKSVADFSAELEGLAR